MRDLGCKQLTAPYRDKPVGLRPVATEGPAVHLTGGEQNVEVEVWHRGEWRQVEAHSAKTQHPKVKSFFLRNLVFIN